MIKDDKCYCDHCGDPYLSGYVVSFYGRIFGVCIYCRDVLAKFLNMTDPPPVQKLSPWQQLRRWWAQ